ncbi:MAG: acyltransferase [Myxococcales bacterium]
MKALEEAWTRLRLRRCASVGRGVRLRGGVWVHGEGAVRLGDGVVLDGAAVPIELHAGAGAEIVVGPGTVVRGGTSIEAMRSVTIGARCRVGAFCKILDNHFHVVRRMATRPPSLPVSIEDDALLGPRCVVLPGGHIARGEALRGGTVRAGSRR